MLGGSRMPRAACPGANRAIARRGEAYGHLPTTALPTFVATVLVTELRTKDAMESPSSARHADSQLSARLS